MQRIRALRENHLFKEILRLSAVKIQQAQQEQHMQQGQQVQERCVSSKIRSNHKHVF